MLSSNGTVDFPSWRSSPTLIVTGWAAVAPAGRLAQGGHDLPAVGLGHDVGERTHLDELGIVAQQPGDRPRGGFEEPGGGHEHDDGADVVHQGPEACLAAAGQLETPALGQVAQAEEHEVLAGEFERGADDLDQAPSRDGLDADLNGVADLLVLNGGEGAEHQLLVVRVHQAQARDADPVGQRPAEQALRRRVAPGDVAVLVDDDDAVGQLQHGAGQRGHVRHGWWRPGAGSAGRRACPSPCAVGACRRRRVPAVVPASSRATPRLYCRTYPPSRVVAIWLHRHEDSRLHGRAAGVARRVRRVRRGWFSRWSRRGGTRADAVDADEQVGQRVDQRRPLHRQPPLMPGQAQLAQGADLRVGGEAGTQVRLRVRSRRCHPSDGHVDDLVPKGAERATVGLGEQHPGETLVVDQRADERPEPRLGRSTGPRRAGTDRRARTSPRWHGRRPRSAAR